MMKEVTIWHNARCGKSRATLALLKEHGHEPRIVRYLDDSPSAHEVRRVLDLLGYEPRALMRTNEDVYNELGLGDEHDDEALILAMVENPILIQRPIVICGNRVAMGRPPEIALAVLNS
jgi:arsenate reductase